MMINVRIGQDNVVAACKLPAMFQGIAFSQPTWLQRRIVNDFDPPVFSGNSLGYGAGAIVGMIVDDNDFETHAFLIQNAVQSLPEVHFFVCAGMITLIKKRV